MVRVCVVCKFRASSGFLAFPKDARVLGKWCNSLGISVTDVKPDSKVCYKHFFKSDIVVVRYGSSSKIRAVKGKSSERCHHS